MADWHILGHSGTAVSFLFYYCRSSIMLTYLLYSVGISGLAVELLQFFSFYIEKTYAQGPGL